MRVSLFNHRPRRRSPLIRTGSAMAVCALVAGVVLVATGTPAQASPAPGLNYVALGDSYSSGEGNPPFDPLTNSNGDFCHRAFVAYPYFVENDFETQPVKFYACSGAVTANILTDEHYTEIPQIDEPGVDASANLLTLTIGGNDAGFSSVLQACIVQTVKARANNFVVGPIGRWLGLDQDPSCAHSSSFTISVDDQINAVFSRARDTYAALRAVTDPVHTSIIASDYPRLFPDSQAEQTCIQLSPFLTVDDQNWMNGEGDFLDDTLTNAAASAGVNLVDVRGVFTGHAVCGNDGAWLNGLSIASGGGGSAIPLVGSFHPNISGHILGYSAAFEDYINSATDLTPEGLPANPPPAFAASAVAPAVTGADSITELTVTPTGVTYPSCEKTFRPGEKVKVTGRGFAPSTTVTVYSSSPGQANLEQQVGSVTADSSGAVSTVVSIPLGATGFTQSGSNAALLGLDAIGPGADGSSHADALTMVGLANPRSLCGGATPLAGGEFHSLVVNADGTVAASGNNTYGQLGNGTTTSSTTAVQVSGLTGMSEVTAADFSSYAMNTTGTVYAWGDNTFGQLGNGTTTASSTPVQVPGAAGVTQLAAGNYHVLALKPDGTVLAWGLNNAGQLGNNTMSISTTPVAVPGLTNVVQVAAGGLPGWAGHSVALRNDGTVWTWGYGKHGQLGRGANASNPIPTQVPNLTGIVQIAANGDNTYALKSDGTVYAWGDSLYGQIGNTSAAQNQNTPLQAGITDVRAIAAASTNVMAIKNDGTVWDWGNNNTGQLGDGAACGKTCTTPVRAAGLTGTGSIAGGYVHCLAEVISGSVYGWGSNTAGQLGNGSTTVAVRPTLVTGVTAEH
jgi:alpha-tubulin suppressor-like RCC1 family protein